MLLLNKSITGKRVSAMATKQEKYLTTSEEADIFNADVSTIQLWTNDA